MLHAGENQCLITEFLISVKFWNLKTGNIFFRSGNKALLIFINELLLWKSEAKTDKAIADGLGVSVNTVRRCIDRYLNSGINLAIFDDERSGRPAEITDDAKSWIVSIACQKPCDLGYAAELWTLAALHKHIQAHAEEAGYPRLKTVTKPWLQKYLKKTEIKPFKIKYYLEREDSESSYRTTGIWHILFRMMKNPAFRLLSTNTPTIIQQRKTVISVEIMSMCGLERCHCLLVLTPDRWGNSIGEPDTQKFWFY